MEIMDEEMPTSTNEPEIDPDIVVQKWLDKFQDNTLSTLHFKEHWRICVPRIYSPSKNDTCLSWCFNEELGQKLLFNTLEQFICNGDPNMLLTQLSRMEKAPSVCGRVFKMGEPTYSCRECGMDNTCVLCVDCFKHSEHRYHKYKMGTSSGGGCCDCGDIEAWKKAPFCETHSVGLTKTDTNQETNKTIPNDLKERTRIVFDAILWYCYHLLSTEQISDLRLGDMTDNFFNNDLYCTILYNDEIHTFEQVIGTLTRVKLCNQKTAIEFVTNIDREGRAIVKCSTFRNCDDLKKEIEKHTSRQGDKAVKVIVSHAHVIAHQIYAIKLLKWLESFLSNGECFREIFTNVAIQPQFNDPCIIKGILLRDSTLWKMARSQWQRLLISGMLLEYDNKKELAKIFTRNYGAVMKDFIKDDHDHSYSISSLSVQLFTVPTLAHYLIANDDVLFILLNTFMSECLIKCNKSGKLEFERNPSSHTFKRAQYMLYDLRYLLSSIPEQWTDDLRRNFLHGLSILLNLLTKMQGMDSVVRQVGQHMEYEPEWESAFNLHIKLAYCISLMIKWCNTDKVVLIKSYRSVLKKLYENPIDIHPDLYEVNELVDHSCTSIVYDVSLKAVSIHLPLTRFFAGLYLNLEKFGLNFDSLELQTQKPTPVQILEPVLRCQVMIAQVHAGMWRRNGYALLNQLYYYHNVKCRTEMLDRDIILLQICASLIESNEFLIHLLYKFSLIHWATVDYESNSGNNKYEDDSIRQTVCLVEEFLQLLIVIIGERFIPGISNVTIEDRIKKEIIQYLCIKPFPHSALNKIIPEDVGNETTLDDVIDELATFKKPTNQTKGVYELKPEFFDEYNVFFYHYTREELSKSEETQRKRRKLLNELECCPPPKLLKLNESFNMLVNLLQCDVMLHLMQLILERCNNLRAKSFSELQLHKCLHLIGYALLEEESKNYPFFKFIQNSRKFNIYPLMTQLLDCPRVDAHKDLLKWTIKKYRNLDEQTDEIIENSTNEPNNDIVIDNEKERRAKLAAERRAKLMAQMTAMQKNFMKENATLFDTIEDIKQKSDSVMDLTETETNEQQIAIGQNRTQRMNYDKSYTCILCQEESTINGPTTLVLAGFVQQATVLCQYKDDYDFSKHDPLYLDANLGPAPYTSTCGHVMHSECWRKHFDNVMLKEHRRPYRNRHPASFDVDKQEFLCPLCECLSNTVLPLVPPLNSLIVEEDLTVDLSFDDWLMGIDEVLCNKEQMCHGIFKCLPTCQNVHCLACVNSSTDNMDSDLVCEANCILQPYQIFESSDLTKINNLEFNKLFPYNSPDLSANLKETIQLFAQVTYTRGLNLTPHPTDKRLAPMVWKTLSYTIHAIEVLLRDSNKALLGNLSCRQRDCIETLTRLVGVLGSTWQTGVVIHNYAINLLTILFEHTSDCPSILQWDSLGFLIPLTFALPSLAAKDLSCPIPVGGVLELYELRTIFVCHIVKILILLDLNHYYQNSMEYESENGILLQIYNFLNINTNNLNCDLIWKHVQDASLPFLRCCCLFYHYLTDVPAPSKLQELNGDTFENMCTYLDLPQSPSELFHSEILMDLIKKWCQHEEISMYLNGINMQIVREPLPVNHLVDLPTDYSELINTVSTFTCPNNDEVSRNPTMCLVCGEILCSQAYCCQTELNKTNVGACNYHAYKCGAGVGIFLRVRECEILFLATPRRGCFVSPPYIDDYGETDQGLRRGNPLKLCPERYRKLQTRWLSHSLHEEIARDIGASNHIVTTQWNHL